MWIYNDPVKDLFNDRVLVEHTVKETSDSFRQFPRTYRDKPESGDANAGVTVQESVRLFWNPMVKRCNGIFL